MVKKQVLVALPEQFRVIRYDERNLALEIWREKEVDGRLTGGYVFWGFYSSIQSALRAVWDKNLLPKENGGTDLKSALDYLSDLEQKLERVLQNG